MVMSFIHIYICSPQPLLFMFFAFDGIFVFIFSLGKTIQIIGFLSGLFDMEKLKNVMIVLPVSVMINWEKEFNKWSVFNL